MYVGDKRVINGQGIPSKLSRNRSVKHKTASKQVKMMPLLDKFQWH